MFFFYIDGAGNLDAYQQILTREEDDAPIYGLSGTGGKRLVALSGKAGETAQWMELRNYGSLCKYRFLLADDSPDAPLLVGETEVENAESRRVNLPLHPMLSCIRIRSVSCDFTGRPYAGQTFHNDILYLSYAGTECFPVGTGDRAPVSWLNAGAVDSVGVFRLPHPEFLLQEGWGETGRTAIHPERSLYCYPHPMTRLVLGGTVDGRRCYYPIPLRGVEAGKCYEMDIALLRTGTPDPDIPAESGSFAVTLAASTWNEHSAQTLPY